MPQMYPMNWIFLFFFFIMIFFFSFNKIFFTPNFSSSMISVKKTTLNQYIWMW